MGNEEKLIMLEEAFDEFFNKEIDESKLCTDLGRILSTIDNHGKRKNYKFEVIVSNHSRKELFFGMRIFPALCNGDEGSPEVTRSYYNPLRFINGTDGTFRNCYEHWCNLDRWVLEIDEAALDRHEIDLLPKELVAMILHELGHVIYSEKTFERIYQAIMDMKVAQTEGTKKRMKVFDYLFYPVIIAACKVRKWVVGDSEMRIELFADKTAVEFGYGEYLKSAFGKSVKKFGRTDLDTFSPDTEAKWAVEVIGRLSARHANVGKDLYVKAARTDSKLIKTLYRNIMLRLGTANRVRYTGEIEPQLPAIEALFAPNFIQENDLIVPLKNASIVSVPCNSANNAQKIAVESFNKKTIMKKDNEVADMEYMLDTIRIDIDHADSVYAKKNIIDRIYKVEELSNTWDFMLDEFPDLKPRYAQKLKRIKERCENYKEETLNKKIIDHKYDVFVKYPVGYEG